MYWDHEEFRNTTDFKHIKENVSQSESRVETYTDSRSQYTKSHYDVNPKAITPLGPWPHIEKGYEEDWSKLSPGSIDMPEVLEHEKTLEV
jgi:putative glutathione S-transferase